jgi:hypothetical protein
MKQISLILVPFLLSACLATPVKRTFPDIPEDLKTACPDLAQMDLNTNKLSEVVKTVTVNYSTYHECKIRVDAWMEWYKTQKSIFEEVR